MIYPCEKDDQTASYEPFLTEVKEWWENFTTGKRKKQLPQLTAPHSCVSGNLKSLGK